MGTAVLRSQDCLRSTPRRPKPGILPRPHLSSPLSSTPILNNPNPRASAAKGSPFPAKPARNGNSTSQGRSGGRRSRAAAADDAGMVLRHGRRAPVMGEVTILKRGEGMKPGLPLESPRDDAPGTAPAPTAAAVAVDDVVFSSTGRLGPEPEILPKQIRLPVDHHKDVYAGSGFITSPSPSSLPFPSFFARKELVDKADLATKGLRYLLRLDLP